MSIRNKASDFFLPIVLLISAALRFYHFSDWSLSNDELSALYGVNLGNINRVIFEYVYTDFHPAGVEIFLFYWVKVFGDSAFSIRLPFVIAGVLSSFFIFLIASKWFNKTVGLFCALSISILEYPILYSQIARPYSSGLLFSLMMAWCWTLLVFDTKNSKGYISNFKLISGYAISTVLCMYNHYFSFLFAIIVGITGLFFLNKTNYKSYLLSGVIAVIIFLPHLSISLVQFGRGGLSDWLGKPGKDYLWKYLKHCFNDSNMLLFVFIGLFIISIFSSRGARNPFRFICLVWFFLPFSIGYFYSLYINPVLQYSILIFSFPFLLIFLFSFFKEEKFILNSILFFILGISGIYSTVVGQGFYKKQHFAVFKEIAQNTINYFDKYGEKNICPVISCTDPFFINYYFNRLNRKVSFVSNANFTKDKIYDFNKMVDTCNSPYLLYAWTNSLNPLEVHEIIMEKYPLILQREYYFNAEIYLFGKKNAGIDLSRDDLNFKSINSFEIPVDGWAGSEGTIVDSKIFSGNKAVRLEGALEYSPTFKAKVGDILKTPDDIINVSLMGYLATADAEAQVVIAFENKGENLSWSSNKFSYFLKQPTKWGKVFFSLRLPEKISKQDLVSIYVWDNSKKLVFIDNIEVKITKGNPIIYGKRDWNE